MGLFLLDYGAGNVQSLANSLRKLGHEFDWISCPDDFDKATSLIFPGVGAFDNAIVHLSSQGLLDPLRAYIQSGRPYFGICLGLQILFQYSIEPPSSNGLGIIPSPILRFDESEKSVPHIGWNSANLFHPEDSLYERDSQHFYFVHSYCAKYDPLNYPEAANWAYTTTQYGKELFISSVWMGNTFGTQFHPEKSGQAGLRLLDAWLSSPKHERVTSQPSLATLPQLLKTKDGFTKRIIACMDVRTNDEGDLVVTKGDQYDVREKVASSTGETTFKMQGAVRNLGKPVSLAAQYYTSGADELCFLNITSFRHSPLNDQPMIAVVRAAAACVFVPLTIGGGIKDTVDPDGTKRSALEVAGAYFRAGADKVSIGSEAVYAVERLQKIGNGKGDGTSAIESIARVYGSQAIVVSIDPKRVYVDPQTYKGPYSDELVYGRSPNEAGKAWWYQCTVSGGRESRPISALQLAKGAEKLGAGEILLNCIDRDGTGLGFDLDLLKLVKQNVSIPVVASSGAGKVEHFVEVFEETGVEAALAAGIFHRKEVGISEVKDALRHGGIKARS